MNALRILITGSREWADREAITRALVKAGRDAKVHPQKVTVVHGGARGVDTLAGEIAAGFGCAVEVHRADWVRHGRSAGHRRNASMVALGADLVLAFHLNGSPGTAHCMALARKAGIPVVEHTPAGVS